MSWLSLFDISPSDFPDIPPDALQALYPTTHDLMQTIYTAVVKDILIRLQKVTTENKQQFIQPANDLGNRIGLFLPGCAFIFVLRFVSNWCTVKKMQERLSNRSEDGLRTLVAQSFDGVNSVYSYYTFSFIHLFLFLSSRNWTILSRSYLLA
jgi:hypothetical protein